MEDLIVFSVYVFIFVLTPVDIKEQNKPKFVGFCLNKEQFIHERSCL